MEDNIDIILTTYNTKQEYLGKQINSILNQTYANFNLLISDDNSSDENIKKILEEYSKKDTRIKIYFQKENIGYIRNFEFLLKQSIAEYIMFCDHDDIWYKDKIEKSLKKIKEENVDMVYCNSEQINERDEIIQADYFKYKNIPLVNTHSKLAISRCVGIGCSQIFSKEIKEKMLPFKENVIAHDWLAAFIANEKKGITYIIEPLFGYRLHNSNVFGGRNLSQNLNRWKKENGDSYNSYLKYRKEKVIDKAYLEGAEMCLSYAEKQESKIFLKKLIQYYTNIEKSKYINIHIIKYFKFLGGKNLLKKEIKEIFIFHFPLVGYIKFRLG